VGEIAAPSGAALPLAGVTVLDCGQVVAGPMAAMLLGDFGAEVIKVEQPGTGDQMRYFGRRKGDVPLHWKHIARNKKSITLALNKEEGQRLFMRLVAELKADVVIESFRPGTFERWGLDYDRLRSLNRGVTLVRFSGFGQTGPYRERPGFGTLAEAMSGFAHVTGERDGPPTLPPFPLADSVAALYAAHAAMVCLYHRDLHRTGTGQCIDVSLLEPLFSLLAPHLVEYDQLGIVSERNGNRIGSAPRNTYRTKDERWIAIAGSTQSIATRLFRTMGRPELIEDPRFATNPQRVANVEELDEIVGAWVSEFSQEEILSLLVREGVAAAPILNIEDLANDPHFAARRTIEAVPDEELGAVRMPAVLPLLSESPGRIDHAGPALGAHNREVYEWRLGLDAAELARLQEEGVI
jgi:formyl-CoA transferase